MRASQLSLSVFLSLLLAMIVTFTHSCSTCLHENRWPYYLRMRGSFPIFNEKCDTAFLSDFFEGDSFERDRIFTIPPSWYLIPYGPVSQKNTYIHPRYSEHAYTYFVYCLLTMTRIHLLSKPSTVYSCFSISRSQYFGNDTILVYFK